MIQSVPSWGVREDFSKSCAEFRGMVIISIAETRRIAFKEIEMEFREAIVHFSNTN